MRSLIVALGALLALNAAADCEVKIEVGDALKYSTTEVIANASCKEFTVELIHSGTLPAVAMGHNWVLSADSDVDAIATAGIPMGVAKNYLPDDDDRILAATKIIGGGESTSVSFSLDDLESGTAYAFFCSFPGHTSMMRGVFKIG